MDLNYDQFNGDALIFKYNLDEYGNPISIKVDKEEKQVSVHGTIQLEYVPDEYNRVVILNEDNTQMTEVFNRDEIKPNTYYVDYNNGVVYLDKSQFGKTKIYNYYKKGLQLIGCSRIYDEHDISGKHVVLTLQEIIDAGREALRFLLDIGDAKKVIELLESLITEGKLTITNLENKKNECIQSINNAISQATQDKNEIVQEIQENIQEALDSVINVAGNKEVLIQFSEWALNGDVYEKQINHTLNSENLHVTAKNSDTKEAVTIGYKIINKTTILLKSDEAINMSVVLSASYYHATQTISDSIAEEVVKARKGEVDLKTKIDSIDEQLEHIANKGTTVEVLERVTKEEIDKQIADGTIANLTIEDDSVTQNKVTFISECKNLIDINKKVVNKYWVNNVGNVWSGDGQECSQIPAIKLKKNTTYSINKYYGGFTFLCNSVGKIETIIDGNTFTTNETAVYCYITLTTDNLNVMLVEGDIPKEYKEFNEIYDLKVCGISILDNKEKNVFYVGANEDIKTLKQGIELATKEMNSTLILRSGIYDLVQEYGAELDTYKGVGLILKNNIKIIAESGAKVVFKYYGDNTSVYSNFSPFNSGIYGFTIEGSLEIDCVNCRYCVHDERGNSTDFYRNIYKNIKMNIDNTENPHWKNPQVIGNGLGSNGIIEIENCDFGNWITFHNNNGSQTKGSVKVIIKNNFFRHGSVIVGSYGDSTDISQFIINGNWLKANINNLDTESTINKNIEVIEFNNVIK